MRPYIRQPSGWPRGQASAPTRDPRELLCSISAVSDGGMQPRIAHAARVMRFYFAVEFSINYSRYLKLGSDQSVQSGSYFNACMHA